MGDYTVVGFDRNDLARLQLAVAKAKLEGADQFTFDGHEYLIRYAEYLIEYLNQRFTGNTTKAN